MTTELEKIVFEIEGLTEAANINLDTVPTQNKGGMGVAKVDAINRLKQLKSLYREAVRARTFNLILTGAPEDQLSFSKIAEEEAKLVVVSAQAMFHKMATEVDPALGSMRQFGTTALGLLIREVEVCARFTETWSLITPPRINEAIIANTFQDLVEAIRGIVNRDCGIGLVKDFIEHQAFLAAFDKKLTENVIPVVVLDGNKEDAEMLKGLLNGKGFEVKVPAKVTKEFVLETFKKIKTELNKVKKH